MMAAPGKPTPAVIIHAARASNNRYAQVPTASGLTALAARGLCAKLFVGLRLSAHSEAFFDLDRAI
jgi:hypothetical protein